MTDPVQPVTISTPALIAAFAQGLLSSGLLGPGGIAASALVPAAEGLVAMFRNQPAGKNYTIDELEAIVTKGSADLAKLAADVAAQGDAP